MRKNIIHESEAEIREQSKGTKFGFFGRWLGGPAGMAHVPSSRWVWKLIPEQESVDYYLGETVD